MLQLKLPLVGLPRLVIGMVLGSVLLFVQTALYNWDLDVPARGHYTIGQTGYTQPTHTLTHKPHTRPGANRPQFYGL